MTFPGQLTQTGTKDGLYHVMLCSVITIDVKKEKEGGKQGLISKVAAHRL